MAEFKGKGVPEMILAEELAEVIQVMAEAIQTINKKVRFQGTWDEIPPGKDKTRWEELESEMQDVIFAWNDLQLRRKNETMLKEFHIIK